MKRIVILGSTGSIGENALQVVRALPERLSVVGLAAHSNHDRLLEQASEFGVDTVALADPGAAARCRQQAPAGTTVLEDEEGLSELAMACGADMVLCGIVGFAALCPVLAALEHGIDVAIATKEIVVAAGPLVTAAARRGGAALIPVDSEHSALFQCIGHEPADRIARLVVTGSGGPFFGRPDVRWPDVTVEEALAHPRWTMGRKISVDSATLMNKGLEIIEAHQLFGVPLDRIELLIHPESIVHSMVEFVDGAVLAELNPADMRYAIQYALTYPDRLDGGLPRLDIGRLGTLTFKTPDPERFPAPGIARAAAAAGGTMPAVLNAANEVAVARFLAGDIPFFAIWRMVEETMACHEPVQEPTLHQILEADRWARETARKGSLAPRAT